MKKKILVTGGCGFVGSWCCEYYISKGWEVIAFDNMTKHELSRTGYNTEKIRNYNVEYLTKIGVNVVMADIRNRRSVFTCAEKCDFIIHTAAQPAMTISMEDPDEDLTTNICGTWNVLEAARVFQIPMINCSTIHVYGNEINNEIESVDKRYMRNPMGISEGYPMLNGTLTPLHASKATADIYTKVYIDTYKVKAASFRLTGLYGERQFGGEDHGWVANFCIKALLSLPIKIYGTGWQVRDILYVGDLIEAFDSFYNNQVSGIYNVGGGVVTSTSLLGCLEIISEILKKDLYVQFHPSRHGDLKYFVCDNKKIRNCLGWRPKTKPEEGITKLINWIKPNINLFKGSL